MPGAALNVVVACRSRGEFILGLNLRRSSAQYGFTLIEMMVVLLIMGIFVGLVSSVAQPDDRTKLRLEAERLAQLLELASTKSRLTGRRIAWTAEGSSYRFWQFNEDTYWTDIRDDDALRVRALPNGMVIAGLQVENMRTTEQMRLEFTPYGESVAFSVQLSFGDARKTVAGSPVGEVYVVSEQGSINGETVQR